MLRLIPILILFSFPLFAQGLDVDNDGDGWTENQGDCCDVPTASCTQPAMVNPGAFEIPGNMLDDNCNLSVDEPTGCDGMLESNSSVPLDYAKAMELCQSTLENPPIPERHWGVIDSQLTLADGTGTPAANSRAIRSDFGSASFPVGLRLSVLSTGHAADRTDVNPAFRAFQTGADMMTQSAFPADWYAANGNSLPNSPGCPSPQGSVAYDPVMLSLRIRVPTNARSFSFSSRFFSSEYPEYVCSPYNDFFVVLLDSSYAGPHPNPPDKNIGNYNTSIGDFPIGVNLAYGTGLFQACVNGSTGCGAGATAGNTNSCTGIGDLNETGFDDFSPGNCDPDSRVGGGTRWLLTQGNIVPGETIDLRIAIWDTSDHTYDSVALVDNFQWSVDVVTPGTFIGYTSLRSSPNPSQAGQPVTFTATVAAAAGTAGGDVVFKDGSIVLGTRPLNPLGVAELTTSTLSAGNHAISAHYQGGSVVPASSSFVLIQTVQGIGNVRSWVASNGVDSNPCSRSLPCRTFATAAGVVNSGGEIVVSDSGGYGAVTLTKSVTILSPEGIHAAIAPTGGNGITVSAGIADVVTLRGLYLNSQGAANGIVYNSGAALQVESCVISGFSGRGIDVTGALELSVDDTVVRDNGGDGIHIQPLFGEATAFILRTQLESNDTGLFVSHAAVAARQVTATRNETGFAASQGTLRLDHAAVLGNGTGLIAIAGGKITVSSGVVAANSVGIDSTGGSSQVFVSNSTITANDVGIGPVATSSVYTHGNNRLAGNATNGAFGGNFGQQ